MSRKIDLLFAATLTVFMLIFGAVYLGAVGLRVVWCPPDPTSLTAKVFEARTNFCMLENPTVTGQGSDD
jgi:hypothetical protein